MQTSLGWGKPCVYRGYKQTPTNYPYYPLENARRDKEFSCKWDSNIDQQYDSRYEPAGFTISMYELQMNSGVLKKLHELPLFNMYVKDEFSAKMNIKYDFMTRSRIPWKL